MRSASLWLCFLLLTFLVSSPVTWWGMTKADFFYSSLYETIGIDEHIQRYAPRNLKGKLEFEKTTKEDHVELFSQVVISIHNEGKGLDSLSYTKQSNQQSVALFTEAEVVHLEDVANLLDFFKPLILVLIVVWFIVVIWIVLKRVKLPSSMQFSSYAVIMLVLVTLVLATGPEEVFNQLHIWAFPDGHQWFFYYEESLMSTMMMAPNLFAYIAGIWCILSIILTALILKLMRLMVFAKRNA